MGQGETLQLSSNHTAFYLLSPSPGEGGLASELLYHPPGEGKP